MFSGRLLVGALQNFINTKIRYVCARFVSLLPCSFLRVLAYRFFPGYSISFKARIGFGATISVQQAKVGAVTIGRMTIFKGPFTLELEDGTSIGEHNVFSCPTWVIQGKYRQRNYLRLFRAGAEVKIIADHFFDVSGGMEIGQKTWIAGRGSQFWTHGTRVKDRPIRIGQSCYIGSAVRMAPGSEIGDHSLVAMGSVVVNKFLTERLLIGGSPAKVLRKNYQIPGWENPAEERSITSNDQTSPAKVHESPKCCDENE